MPSSRIPPSPSAAGDPEPATEGGEAELRKDSMMAHLLDSLEAGKDIGHYGPAGVCHGGAPLYAARRGDRVG